jgi:hypothetical protein
MAAFGVTYHDTAYTRCPRAPESFVATSLPPWSETERRADVRNAPKVNQVR